jgi:hypothetical protein
MKILYVRYILLVLLLLPIIIFFRHINLQLIFFILIFLTGIPFAGLLSKKSWFFYYIYITTPLWLIITIFAVWFLSLFGDQAYSILDIALSLWPLLLYFGVIITLTIIIQKHQKE